MADKAEVMKWFAGREVEVLDDQKGRTTVSAWREQLLNAAARMCGATGRKMLHGEFPKIEADEYYTPGHIMNIINDIFKRSKTREKMNNWFIEDNNKITQRPRIRQIERLATTCLLMPRKSFFCFIHLLFFVFFGVHALCFLSFFLFTLPAQYCIAPRIVKHS